LLQTGRYFYCSRLAAFSTSSSATSKGTRMKYFFKKIQGVPYSQAKRRGNIDAPGIWTKAIIEQTRDLPSIKEACVVKVTFLLPSNKFPTDFPFGPDLDNLLKRLFDALNETVFRESKGNDSCIISLHATKTRVNSEQEAGVLLEVLPVTLS
jgi:Holliday junction resolvase RusA-like endonuclease